MSIEKLNAALVKAVGELREPHKAGKADTGTYGYTYLTLADLSQTVREAFARHGLAFTQHIQSDRDGTLTVTTRVVHDSGATWRTEPLTRVLPGNATMQSWGSTVTYARRYQLAALVGLSGSDDDDGAQAGAAEPSAHADSHSAPPVGKRGSAAPPSGKGSKVPKGATPKQVSAIRAALRKSGFDSDESAHAAASAWVGREIDSMGMLTVTEASDYLEHLWATKQAERIGTGPDGEPPEDPWANHPEGTLT